MQIASPGWVFLIAFIAFTTSAASAASLEGRVTAEGAPVAGAMVTARSPQSGVEVTVFSASDGAVRVEGLDAGAYDVVAKTPSARTATRRVKLSRDATLTLSFALQPAPDPLHQIPSAAWLDLLPAGPMKREFVLNCGSCHEIAHRRVMRGSEPRSVDDWAAAIALMRAIDVYGLTPPDFDDARYAAWLAEHLDAEAIATLRAPAAATGPALTARITEYPVPQTPSLPHDLVVGPAGRVWVTAFYNNALWALDPESGKTQTYPVNAQPDVMGQVRALAFGPDGALWTLLGGTQSLVRLDPSDGKFETFPVGMYPHSIEIDSKGTLWFNDYLSPHKRLGRLNPQNQGEVQTVSIPGSVIGPGEGLPLLYGLQIDREDVLWGTMLAANQLFRFDPATGDAELFAMPADNSGPRRPAIAPDGSVWIPEFNTGTLTRFDPQTRRFSRHSLGATTLGPYDVAVDPVSGEVWVAAALGSAMFRFNPETEALHRYPFPTEPAYPRHIAIDARNGDVWTTYSSMPDATPKIVRIELGESRGRPASED